MSNSYILYFNVLVVFFIVIKATSVTNVNQLSSSAKSSLQTVFACYKVNPAYSGPTFQFRRSSDDNQTNFYADVTGNLGTGLNGSATSLSSWLSLVSGSYATAYVSIWCDQSGHGKNAYQTTTSKQPKFDRSLLVVDFKSTNSVYLVMDPTSFSLGDNPYTIIVKHGTMGICSNMYCNIFEVGAYVTKHRTGLYTTNKRSYLDSWKGDDILFGNSITSGTTVSMIYDQSQRLDFINGDLVSIIADNNHNTGTSFAYLGGSTQPDNVVNSMNGELYHFYSFSSVLSTSDRSLVEGFPLPVSKPVQQANQIFQLFSYTGYVQNFTVPSFVYRLKVIVSGASGGYSPYACDSHPYKSGAYGGYGANVSTTLLHCVGGFNGGGISGTVKGAGGGGASDIRVGTSLSSRKVVAGGGGGGANVSSAASLGGAGGTPNGVSVCDKGATCSTVVSCAGGGGQSTGGSAGIVTEPGGLYSAVSGSFGYGGYAYSFVGGGGGGGWYGGGGGGAMAGGGGSSYCSSTICSNTTYSLQTSYGDGMVWISYSVPLPSSKPSSGPSTNPSTVTQIPLLSSSSPVTLSPLRKGKKFSAKKNPRHRKVKGKNDRIKKEVNNMYLISGNAVVNINN